MANNERYITLTPYGRQSLAWSSQASRRKTIPTFTSSLSRSDVRERRCNTCRRVFSNVNDLRKHVSLTHTGIKPVVCEICGKRFERESHMRSHYEMHKEPRLQEFAILSKRRKVKSEPPSSPSQTTIGSFHGVPRKLKQFYQPESSKSFGTRQSYHVSEKADKRDVDADSECSDNSDIIPEVTANSKNTTRLPNVQALGRQHRSADTDTRITNRGFPKSACQNLPRIDPGSISVLGSVTGMNVAIATSEQSRFVERSADRSMRRRTQEDELAGLSPRRNSHKTGSAPLDNNIVYSRTMALNRLSSGSTVLSRGERRRSSSRLKTTASSFIGR